ncbi:hypothetical protein HA402_002483 [Bradysia odoriphaga]|nr:hypothetical protein HA402_002483 [Bradysia odoriphaga]
MHSMLNKVVFFLNCRRNSSSNSNDVSSQTFAEPNNESDYSDEEDVLLLKDFDENEARQKLLEFKGSHKVTLSQEIQKEVGLEVGVNITAEHPFKQIKRTIILDSLTDESLEIEKLRDVLNRSEMDVVLVGYVPVPTVSGNQDKFLFFQNDSVAREASEIIEKLEAYERRKSHRSIYKRPRPWKSLGSEKEVDFLVDRENKKSVDVDIQCIYKVNDTHTPFTQRLVADARDGYIDLVLKKGTFENLERKRIDIPIQSSAKRVTREQQTDPTFPSDEWSQYLYQIERNEKELAEAEAKEEAGKLKIKGAAPPEPIKPSFQAKELLETLEFNEVDMYRNDYPYVAKKQLTKYKTPHLKEAFCFINLSQSIGRFVSSIAWNPKYSSIFVAAYTSSTLSTLIDNSDKTDSVKETVLQPSTVLLWTFDDIFQPQMQLSTPQEVSYLSYCPYDEDLIVGGLVNGQLILWNMTNRLADVEKEVTARLNADVKKKSLRSFLDWEENNQFRIVQPVGLSSLTVSHTAPITAIKWYGRKHYVDSTGTVRENVDPNDDKEYRNFVTTSLDGCISFWDLDFSSEDKKKGVAILREKYSANCGPVFTIVFGRPITNILFDDGIFEYKPDTNPKNRKITARVPHNVEQLHREDSKNRLIVSTAIGDLAFLSLDVIDPTSNYISRHGQSTQPELFASVHDGRIYNISRNRFLYNLFLTFGRRVLALWDEEHIQAPIFWRYWNVQLTDAKWSNDKPSVFFVTTIDGNFEAWDILSRTDGPCLVESIGGNILTLISQHKLSLPKPAVAIGDFNSNVRIFQIPDTLSAPKENETEILKMFIEHKVQRKDSLNQWQDVYYNANADVREAKRINFEQAKQELERLDKQLRDQEDERIRKEEEELKKEKLKGKSKAHYDFAEKLSRKWDEMNMKRMMNAVLAKKFIDPELLALWSQPDKDRIAYNEQKRKAVAESFSKINEDIEELRSRLIPIETNNDDRVTIIKRNIGILEESSGLDFESLRDGSAIEADAVLCDDMDYLTILNRGHKRRQVINDMLGSNNRRRPCFRNQNYTENHNVVNGSKMPETLQ